MSEDHRTMYAAQRRDGAWLRRGARLDETGHMAVNPWVPDLGRRATFLDADALRDWLDNLLGESRPAVAAIVPVPGQPLVATQAFHALPLTP